MLEIRNTSGRRLEFSSDTIELELNNWLLADSNELPGSFSYPIGFPLSDNNKAFLNYRYLPEARPRSVAVTVAINGSPLRRCTLSYKLEQDKASGFLRLDAGEVASRVKDRYLHEALTEKFWLCYTFADAPARMLAMAQADPGLYPITFFPVNNPAFSPDVFEQEPLYEKRYYVNSFENGTFVMEGYGPAKPYGYHVVPYVYLTYVIEKVCAFFGYKAVGSFLQHPDVRTWVLDNTQAIENLRSTPPGGRWLDLGQHVPYITIPDFLRALRDDFGLGIYFDATSLEARFELFDTTRRRSTATDLSRHLLRGYDNDVPDERGFTILSYTDERDEFYKNITAQRTPIRDGQKEVKARIGTLTMLRNFRPNGQGEWLVPAASQRGNLAGQVYFQATDYYSRNYQHKNTFGLRLLSYRGMQPDSLGVLYPYATSISYNMAQERVASLSLDASQADSVYRAWMLPFYFFKAYARSLRVDLLLDLPSVRRLPFYERYQLRFGNSVMSHCLIEQLTLSLPGHNGLIPAKANVTILLPASENQTVYTTDVFYVELVLENSDTTNTQDLYRERADLVLRVWADAARTTPGNPTNLLVHYRYEAVVSGPGAYTASNDLSFSITGHQATIEAQAVLAYIEYAGQVYEFDSAGNYVYTLLGGSGYVAL